MASPVKLEKLKISSIGAFKYLASGPRIAAYLTSIIIFFILTFPKLQSKSSTLDFPHNDITAETIFISISDTRELVEDLIIFIFAIAVAEIISQAVMAFQRSSSFEETKLLISGISEQLHRTVDCSLIGNGNNIYEKFFEEIEGAESVKSTFLVFGSRDRDMKFEVYVSDSQRQQIGACVEKYVEDRGLWHEIFSEDAFLYLDYFKEKRNTEWFEEYADRYISRITKIDFSTMNFAIVDFGIVGGKRLRKVYFGWAHHEMNTQGNLFVSYNEYLIEHFDKEWELLLKNSYQVSNFREKERLLRGDIYGNWVSSAITLANDGESIEDSNIAIIKINSEREKISMSGTIYNKFGTKIGTFNSTSSNLSGRELHCSFFRVAHNKVNSPIIRTIGAMTHTFFQKDEKMKYNDVGDYNIDRFEGEAYSATKQKIIHIYGERIEETPTTRSALERV